MIISRIIGGLGNQMFQYAFGKYLSIKKCTELKLDLCGFEIYDWRVFELGVFNCQIDTASKEEIDGILKPRYFPVRKIDYFGFGNQNLVLNEPNMLFNSKFLKVKKNTYLSGYWQSEKYFPGIREILLDDFKFKPSSDESIQILAERIINTPNSVSVHIRRGDYQNNPQVNKIHGVLPIEYYVEAMGLMLKRTEKPIFYFFSDDIDWVISKFSELDNVFFVNQNMGSNSFEDMRLMSLCKHNIVANSSFSWWGAWLNQNPSKIVIAPKKWFADSIKNNEAKDIVPDSWIKL
jgi:hypothetical protein